MRLALPSIVFGALLLVACSAAPTRTTGRAALEQQVADTERAFAKTMADRDLEAFGRFLSEETVFFSGPTPLHGKAAVLGYWKRFYEKPAAPFSWRPDRVEALDSGRLALSTGPVFDPAGKCIGRFNFDKGQPCEE
jgi:hypothetical protein